MPHQAKRYIQIADQIRTSIITGEFQPGSKLPSERELAQRYSAGRSSIREALTILQGQGLIEIRHGYGVRVLDQGDQASAPRVSQLSDELEILEARVALEIQIVQLAAQRATKSDLAQLADTLWAMEAEVEQGQLAGATELRFQLALAAASHNRQLYQFMATLADHTRATRAAEPQARKRSLGDQRRLLDQYRHLFRAIAVGDRQRAVALMGEHLRFLGADLDREGTATEPSAIPIV